MASRSASKRERSRASSSHCHATSASKAARSAASAARSALRSSPSACRSTRTRSDPSMTAASACSRTRSCSSMCRLMACKFVRAAVRATATTETCSSSLPSPLGAAAAKDGMWVLEARLAVAPAFERLTCTLIAAGLAGDVGHGVLLEFAGVEGVVEGRRTTGKPEASEAAAVAMARDTGGRGAWCWATGETGEAGEAKAVELCDPDEASGRTNSSLSRLSQGSSSSSSSSASS
mmetsp:Transcript_4989/g.12147  ORF Transcript_4989/g.12147 Transcript_4989/m.12147 type:complete len:234 (-) Transcript_4989:204-905(-)